MFDFFNSFYWGCDQIENNFWDYSTFIRYEKHFEDIRKLDGKILTAGVLKRKNWNKNIQKCNFGPTNNGPEQTPKVPRDYLVCLMPKLITTKMSNQKTIHISHYITKAITTYVPGKWIVNKALWYSTFLVKDKTTQGDWDVMRHNGVKNKSYLNSNFHTSNHFHSKLFKSNILKRPKKIVL